MQISFTMAKFQSSPSPKAGSYVNYIILIPQIIVSILSQPEGRELHRLHPIQALQGFVSILSQPEGRELQIRAWIWPWVEGFNPLPARRPGATVIRGDVRCCLMFQSSPSPKAGSYLSRARTPACSKVSILSQPEGRELPVGLAARQS